MNVRANMELSTSGQQQDLPGEETDQGVEAVKNIQNVHLADHESKKEENTLNIESKQVSTKLYEVVRNRLKPG